METYIFSIIDAWFMKNFKIWFHQPYIRCEQVANSDGSRWNILIWYKKNNIRIGLVRFRSILVKIAYLGRALSFHVVIFESALKNANPPQPLGVHHEKPIFKKLPKLNEYSAVD